MGGDCELATLEQHLIEEIQEEEVCREEDLEPNTFLV